MGSFCSQVGKTAILQPSHALLMNHVILREALLANTRRRDAENGIRRDAAMNMVALLT
eukprot:NODE_13629_length_241_cov_139.967742.p1 GENE.NODE_13629_length_241_cov_139.967742~~NODE_13629_length_241_cov_139.967742.p1  ORF type:complete len:58 (+),score=18.79 NODE_13629_length_241_cov_139.967742:3-176(+)